MPNLSNISVQDRVVDEIENSATMWRGIAHGVHGYDAIDTDDAVTVRSEVARLTRLYDSVVKTNTLNSPEHYSSGISMDSANRGLKARPNQPFEPVQPQPQPFVPDAAALPAPIPASGPLADLDESPATHPPLSPSKDIEVEKPPVPVPAETLNETPVADKATRPAPVPSTSSPAEPKTQVTVPPPASSTDPDASPATAAIVPKAKEKSKSMTESSANAPGVAKVS